MVFGKLLIRYLRLNTKVLSSRQFFLLFFISRDFVPCYSRCARYWLPAKATYNLQPTTKHQQPTTNNRQPITDNRQPTTDNQTPSTYHYLLIFCSSTRQPNKRTRNYLKINTLQKHSFYLMKAMLLRGNIYAIAR